METLKTFIEKVVNFFDDFKVPIPIVFLLVFSVVILIFSIFPSYTYQGVFQQAIGLVIKLTPLWLPPMLLFTFWKSWMTYVRADFLKNQEYKLLEIRLPKEIEKTPQAMEAFLRGIYVSPGETTFINRNWEGKVRPWFSLELASFGGEIRFFIWLRDGFKKMVESRFYAQYPNVEIYEVNDYTNYIGSNLKDVDLWGSNFVLTEADSYPIKTYIDHGLDQETEEERKVDPIANLLEFLASVGEGEQVWIQILFQKYKPKKVFKTFGFEKSDWREEAKQEIDKLMMREEETKTPKTETMTPEGFTLQPMLSEGEKQQIKAIERSLEKPGFDSMIRGLYIAEKDKFDGFNIPNMVAAITSFSSDHLNGIKPSNYMADYDFPWQDYPKGRKLRTKKEVIEAYKKRSFLYPSVEKKSFILASKEKPFILTSEEIATIYHFPGWIIQPPTLERIPSRKGKPPSNLPV